ncbi:MAG: aspartate--tRNA ligase [Clostridium sp.]|uniref:aspartate--tRNA ligase n=1 Tax=Clostridium sp. TaxID=1506 RepID=UPI002A89F336|nr:aspartate--tRNA ligase [Clostridium sp.]MDY5098006.1 aspartate--tRNA ligase [Clostridium sp.]
MGEALNGLKRSIMCGELRESHVGNTFTVMGWVQRKRNLGGLIFIDLRDREGILQVVFGEEINKEAFEKANTIRPEYCIAVTGILAERESKNPNMPTGMVELKGTEIKILSESETPPIYIKENLDAGEAIRLKYRYLDLRRPDMQRIFKIRHKAAKAIRDFLDKEEFLEVETPMLTKSTPEGARDYLVPSRNYPGMFYALPQSPQLFKQLLMVSGFDKYFQIVKCFRDEDLRANRQPEFTQVDLEMSFVEQDDVMSLNERLIQHVFKEVAGVDVKLPINRMPYKEAMEKYGSDKPDLRFGLEIQDITEAVKTADFKVFNDAISNGGSVRALCVEGGASMGRKDIDRLGEFVKTYKAKGLAWIQLKEEGVKSPIAKFLKEEELQAIIEKVNAKTGDLILIVADKNSVVFQSLGALRLELSKKLDLIKDKSEFKFTWVTEFPLLEYDEEEERYTAAHHPFTMPMDEDIQYLESDPGRVRAKAYDLVLNGEELGGGSIRIHDTTLQEKMFAELGFTKESAWERFGFLLEAFKFGPPPHGGLAFGFDRMTMFLAGTENIKDVIAFPKNQNAFCPLTEAPNNVDDKQLRELGISKLELEK